MPIVTAFIPQPQHSRTAQLARPRLTLRARRRVTRAAYEFLAGAASQLHSSHVVEVMRLHGSSAWLDPLALESVLGRDYGQPLAQVLAEEIPELLVQPLARTYRRAADYPEALLRAFVALSIVEHDRPFHRRRRQLRLSPRGRVAKRCIEDLLGHATELPRRYRRVVFLDWVDSQAVDGEVVAGVRLVSQAGRGPYLLSDLLPEAHAQAAEQRVWLSHGVQTTVLVQDVEADDELYLLDVRPQPEVHYVTLAMRLLTAASVRVVATMLGSPGFVHVERPYVREAEADSFWVKWHRPVVLRHDDLLGLNDLAAAFRDHDAATATKGSSLAVATGRFSRSFRPTNWNDLVIDLAVGIEAALAGQSSQDLTLSLKSRAAYLLSMPGDPAERIFDHVGHLYRLRSRLVHGQPVTSAHWEHVARSLGFGEQVLWEVQRRLVLDRWRDLLRRAILGRVMLEREPRLWPSDGNMDDKLSGPAGRRVIRRELRQRAVAMHLGLAMAPAGPLRQAD